MLTQLYIRNYALIDELDMPFHGGFSVITGETGAGKSIILGAIGLILGQRAESRLVKQGADRCVIEAHFDLSSYALEPFFSDNDLDYDPTDCIIRRELTQAGKSRAFVNDTPVPLSVLRELGTQLIDIHSQHQNLLLRQEDFQLSVVDIMGHTAQALAAYRASYDRLARLRRDIRKAEQALEEGRENEELLRAQLARLEEIDLEPDMQEELESELHSLEHVEEIKTGICEAADLLNGDDTANALSALSDAIRALDGIASVWPEAEELSSRLSSASIEIDDVADTLSRRGSSLEYDPRRHEQITDLLDTIYSLEHRHRVETVAGLIATRDDIRRQLSAISGGDDHLTDLINEAREAEAETLRLAATLTGLRQEAATLIEQTMQQSLQSLGIPKVRFTVDIAPRELSPDGADAVSFLFSANTGTALQPISQAASGGEIARVMLSLKAMISSAVQLPTIIFDEIDTGVSGRVAEMMATIMRQMGQSGRQVISITHLPQIASQADHHYRVSKEETVLGTQTHMQQLTPDERITEIAQMLSGSDITQAAIDNAITLLKNQQK